VRRWLLALAGPRAGASSSVALCHDEQPDTDDQTARDGLTVGSGGKK
jgi:hypothetical protein